MKTAPIAAASNPSSLSLAAAADGSASPLPVGSGLKPPRGCFGLRVCAAAAQAAEMAARSSAEESDSIVRSCSAAGLGWISRCGPPHDRLCARHWRVRRQCTRVTSASVRHRARSAGAGAAQAQEQEQCKAVQCARRPAQRPFCFGTERGQPQDSAMRRGVISTVNRKRICGLGQRGRTWSLPWRRRASAATGSSKLRRSNCGCVQRI